MNQGRIGQGRLGQLSKDAKIDGLLNYIPIVTRIEARRIQDVHLGPEERGVPLMTGANMES